MLLRLVVFLLAVLLMHACRLAPRGPLVAHLSTAGGDARGFAAIALSFAERNPGHALAWRAPCRQIAPTHGSRILFVQSGASTARVVDAAGQVTESEVTVGDLVVVQPGARAEFDADVALCEFTLPDVPDLAVPRFVRPDWDPRITDTPGGCATETGAYRRILLTWRGEVGPYTYHGLNAHRVRITDSFTHYHPLDGGFDEFYLVQMVQDGARLLTTDRVADIEARSIGREDVAGLLHETPLAIGDLVYLPRGLAHRGVGGVLAQVITVPGFVPGMEIGIDHHLHAINEKLGLAGSRALPVHAEGALRPIVR